MLNKNLDEWLYLTGMENALDELEKAEKNHTEVHRFSDSYRQKQTALLDSICAAEENDERMMFEIEKKNMDGKENKNLDRILKKEVPVHIFYTIVCRRQCQLLNKIRKIHFHQC